jgi:hypothetical protein
MKFDKDELEVNARLRAKGIQHGIRDLIKHPAWCRDLFPELLELFKAPLSPGMRTAIATALFESNPDVPQKRELMRALLGVLKENPERKNDPDYARLAGLVPEMTRVDGATTNHADASHVDELGEMLLDASLGELRNEFTYALRMIGSAEAIAYLEKAAMDPQMASHALRALVLLRSEARRLAIGPKEARLRDDERTLALCKEALKLPGVAETDAIQSLGRMQSQVLFEKEKIELDAWLAQRGVPHGIIDLYYGAAPCPDCVPELLESFKSPWSLRMRSIISSALLRRKPNAAQKRELAETILKIVREEKGEYNHELSRLVLNELANNIGADKVHEIGRMMLDEGYGELRSNFAFALRKFRNADAIAYLKQAAKIPQTAPAALYSLAQMRAEGTLELCEEVLRMPGVPGKDAIKETQRKLQRKLAKKEEAVSHLTTELVPEGLEEWSANLDGPDLKKVLRGIQKCVEDGFGKAEIAEVRSAAEDLSPESTSADEERDVARLKFDVKFNGGDHVLWLEVFCDDEDAYDLCVFGHPKLIKEMEAALEKILPE